MADKRRHISSTHPSIDQDFPPKRSRQDSGSFSSLPNELLVEIFSYLSDVDVVYAFSQLNGRFQHFVRSYCVTFDFKSVSKAKFACVVLEHDTHLWKSLRLSDDAQTPGQITFFSEQFPFAEHVRQLEALSLINMKPSQTRILSSQFKFFTQLVSLTLGTICGMQMVPFALPSLRNLVITSCKNSRWIENWYQLESLEYIIAHDCLHENHLVWPANLKRLRVYFTDLGNSESIYATLHRLSQLHRLQIYDNSLSSSIPNGHKWENLIVSSLPLLTNFQFCFKFWNDSVVREDLMRIASTFSTPFYLHEKHWTVQCDAHQQFSAALLYSLPFAFERFEVLTHCFERSVTTASARRTNSQHSYSNVKGLIVSVNCERPYLSLMNGNLQCLLLRCPGTPADWVFSMMYIRQLSLSSQINMSAANFSRLINATPRLDSLNVSSITLALLTSNWENKSTCDQLAAKVRSLNLCFDEYLSPGIQNHQNYVNAKGIRPIVRTFGGRCQYLTIAVSSREIIADYILRTVRQLRSLTVYLNEKLTSEMISDWSTEPDRALKLRDSFITMGENEYTFWFHN